MVRLANIVCSLVAFCGAVALAEVQYRSPLVDSLKSRASESDFDLEMVPSQCQDKCEIMSTLANCGAEAKCACSDAKSSQLSTCVKCVLSTDRSLEASKGQDVLNQYATFCKNLGTTVKQSKLESAASRPSARYHATGAVVVSIAAAMFLA